MQEMVLQKAIEFIENAQVRSGTLLPNTHTAFNFPLPTTSTNMTFGSPSEFNTATVPTPGDSASNSSAIFGSYINPRRNSIRESSPPIHVGRESPPSYEISQQNCNVLTGSEPAHRHISSVGGSDENLYVLSRESSGTIQRQQQESTTHYNSQYKVPPPPLQLAPTVLNHVYSDVPTNVSLNCNNSEFMECQSQQQQPQPVPCAVIITPDTVPTQTPTANNRSTEPPLQPQSQVDVVDSPTLPQISLSPSVFARMVSNQDNQELTTHHSASNDNLSTMTYLPSPGLVSMGTNNLNGGKHSINRHIKFIVCFCIFIFVVTSPQMASYLQHSSSNITSPIQRIALPFEHYIAGKPESKISNHVTLCAL